MPRTIEHKSTVIEGATFTLLTVGRILRHQTELKLAPERHKGRLLLDQWRQIVLDEQGLEKPARQLTDAQKEAWLKLNKKPASEENQSAEERSELARIEVQMELANEEQRLEITRARLVSFTIPGEEFTDLKTTEDLLSFGPERFAIEVEDAANEDWQLKPAEAENLESPSSLAPLEDGQTNDSTVRDASETESIPSEVAA